jgi:hypothetical protein
VVTGVLVKACQGLLGALGVAQAHHGMRQRGPCPRHERVQCAEVAGEPFGGLERGQRVPVPSERELDPPADTQDRQSRRRLSVRCPGALGAQDPGLCLLGPCLPGEYIGEDGKGHAVA